MKIEGGLLGLGLLLAAGLPASAEGVYKIGVSAGLTGYAATVDNAWRDGVQVAVDAVNAQGGILGRKIQVVVEDNRSEPQEAVTAYKKMISEDKVDVFISGCVSAGNFAAAPMVARAGIPMVLCSILPNGANEVKWAFSTLPPPRFEVESRLEYLQKHTDIRKFGVLHDPTPYANLQAAAAEKEAGQYGLTLVDNQQYRQDDADVSVQIGTINAHGGGAILKIGLGGTTLTAAKNINALGLQTLLLTSLEDTKVFRPIAEVLGKRFFFVASPSEVFDDLQASPLKSAVGTFLTPWRTKYGDRDPNWAARGWDAVMLTAAAATHAHSAAGQAVRDALEELGAFQGTTGIYHITPDDHYGITEDPFVVAQIIGGQVKVAK
jgi:branched-chain amino acid transport system substrate-binding protein